MGVKTCHGLPGESILDSVGFMKELDHLDNPRLRDAAGFKAYGSLRGRPHSAADQHHAHRFCLCQG